MPLDDGPGFLECCIAALLLTGFKHFRHRTDSEWRIVVTADQVRPFACAWDDDRADSARAQVPLEDNPRGEFPARQVIN